MTGSGAMVPLACGTPDGIAFAISVNALPMSIWPQAMLNGLPSSASVLIESGNRVLGGSIWNRAGTRRIGGDRTVVDDAPTLWLLPAHGAERSTSAKKCAGEFTPTTSCQSSTGISSMSMGLVPMPALLNRRSIRPKCRTICANAAST